MSLLPIERARQAKFPEGKKMTVEEVAKVVGPEFKEMNENPPESVKKLREDMEESMESDDTLPIERNACGGNCSCGGNCEGRCQTAGNLPVEKAAASYLDTFFKEKRIPYRVFEVTDRQGVTHSIPNEVVIDMIKQTRGSEKASIEDTLRKIDFKNGDVNHYLAHLAKGLAESYSGALRFASEQEAEKLQAEAEANEQQAEADRAKANAAQMREASDLLPIERMKLAEVRPGQKFVIVDTSIPGGRWVDDIIYDGTRDADREAKKLMRRGQKVQVIDAVWYKPAEVKLRALGMKGAGLGPIERKAASPIGSGKNGYIARYKNKRVEVMADTTYEAQQIAAKHFRAKKDYEVTVGLAEMGGKQVTHMPLMASDKKAYGPGKRITVKDLEEIGGNSLRGGEDLEDLANTLNSAYGMRGAEKAMREADKILGGFGVEAVFEEGEYGNPAMTYINTGDTYNATIVYDVDEDELYVGTWGDWAEYAQNQGRQMRASAKQKLPEELEKHQFTSEDNPNPKGNDKDGDGKTNEPSPIKAKKAGGKASRSGWSYTPEEWREHAEAAFKRLGAKDADEYKRLAKEQKKKMSFPSDGSSGQYDAWVEAMAWAMGEFNGSGKSASDQMLRKAFVPDSVGGWLEWADGTRTAAMKQMTTEDIERQIKSLEDMKRKMEAYEPYPSGPLAASIKGVFKQIDDLKNELDRAKQQVGKQAATDRRA